MESFANKIIWQFCFISCTILCPILNAQETLHVSAFSPLPPASKSRILNVMHRGDVKTAIALYRKHCQEMGKQDFELLQQMSLILLEQGACSSDPETLLMTLFGAGLSTNEKALPIFQQILSTPIPQLQILTLHFLAKYQHNAADEVLKTALSSPFVLTRLEAINYFALKKSPIAIDHAEALMHKLPTEIKPVFAQLFITVGTPRAMKIYRQLLNDQNVNVRVEAILAAAELQRDDVLPQIRTLCTHSNYTQQEACALALGKMKDRFSIAKLETLASSKNLSVKLTACQALCRLGMSQYEQPIQQYAAAGDVFAIALLGEIKGSEDLLFQLTRSTNLQVRINAAMALLELEDERCIQPLCEVLVHTNRDLAFSRCYSAGKGLCSWKATPHALQNFKDNPVAFELCNTLRENILLKIADISDKSFINLSQALLQANQLDLVPVIVERLENIRSPEAIQLLQSYQQKVGAPLIRNYCNLALFRMKIPGPYRENITKWITQQHHQNIIKLREFVPIEMREKGFNYELSPEETSRLFIDSLEALAATQDQEAIDVLLNAIQEGNAKNKYAIAGLLIQATN